MMSDRQPLLPFIEPTIACDVCGRPFLVRVNRAGRWRRFCSAACRELRRVEQMTEIRQRRAAHVTVTTGRCVECGEAFEVTEGRAWLKRYCSNRCRDRAKGADRSIQTASTGARCVECGAEFAQGSAPGPLAKLCSPQCQTARALRHGRARRQALREVDDTCLECGASFRQRKATGALAKTCSPQCRKARAARQRKEWWAQKADASRACINPERKQHDAR